MSFRFLSLDEVLYLQKRQIELFGGQHGVRSAELLESALAQPKAMFGGQFLHEGLFEMAAAYLFHLVQNHPFLDGNKRIGTAAALLFLDLNGFEVNASTDDFEELIFGVAKGAIKKPEVMSFLMKHSREKS